MENLIQNVGLVAGVAMPFWNIPLIIRIVQRRSSADISISWVLGVWGCIVLMFPSTLLSQDIVLKSFGVSNILFFTAVVIVVLKYRKKNL